MSWLQHRVRDFLEQGYGVEDMLVLLRDALPGVTLPVLQREVQRLRDSGELEAIYGRI